MEYTEQRVTFSNEENHIIDAQHSRSIYENIQMN